VSDVRDVETEVGAAGASYGTNTENDTCGDEPSNAPLTLIVYEVVTPAELESVNVRVANVFVSAVADDAVYEYELDALPVKSKV